MVGTGEDREMWGGPRRETPRPRDPDSWRVGARAGPPNGGGRDGRLDRSAYTAAAVAFSVISDLCVSEGDKDSEREY